MPLSAIDSISPAFEHAKKQLFRPFRLGQWLRLAFVGFFAGELSSGGGCNAPNLNSFPQGSGRHTQHFMGPGLSDLHPGAWIGLIAVLLVSGFVLWFVFVYIGSVMRFVLFDSVLQKECHIRAGWAKRQGEGWKLFVFHLLCLVASLVAFSVIVAVPLLIGALAGWWKDPSEHIGGWILVGLPAFALFLVVALGFALVYVLTKDFVVPQIALEDIGITEGWRRLWEMMRAEKGSYAGYIGMKILLAIAAGIVVGIATFIMILVLVIPVVGAVIAGKASGLEWTAATITLAIVTGVSLFAVLMFVISLISVPAIVFFPAYAMYFFAGRYQKLASVVWPVPPAEIPPALPQLPMTPPSSAEPIG